MASDCADTLQPSGIGGAAALSSPSEKSKMKLLVGAFSVPIQLRMACLVEGVVDCGPGRVLLRNRDATQA